MIQRIQTLWLTLVVIASFLTIKFPIYSGNMLDTSNTGGATKWVELTAVNNIIILILTIAVAVASGFIIFLYKNRKQQLRFTLLTLLVAIGILALYYKEAQEFVTGNISLTCLLAFSTPVLLILAAIGIYKDEKLVKSTDRLR